MRPEAAAELSLQTVLETDRNWTAYALADLLPPWDRQASWIAGERSVLMIFGGLQPPLLFAHGEPDEVEMLSERVPPGEYWYTLRPTDFARLASRMQIRDQTKMWRMWFKPPGSSGLQLDHTPVRLGLQDLEELREFYRELDDGPDAFLDEQLVDGVYFGIRIAGRLVCTAGTHVACRPLGVAALGNIATLPDQRDQGLAAAATRAVLNELSALGFPTIVLNVAMDNRPALRLYRKLGFTPYCGFYEGRAAIVERRQPETQ